MSSKKLPTMIVGALPSPERAREMEHRVLHTHFTPDGKIVTCSCGWQSHLCSNDEDLEIEWLEHLGD